ncbi:unnamed protein product [marine sediment metagenome]|uniref:Uncharacterized protein n=1 Tax=marine sediment metagenome TaxID=412755 RepID=X1J4C3_9ZZZZ
MLSEATLEGWRKLNAFRQEWGLDEIPIPDFNNYLSMAEVEQFLALTCHYRETIDFSSSYHIGTRVIKPLLAKALGIDNVADPLTQWNEWCSLLPPTGQWGVQKLMVFEKR